MRKRTLAREFALQALYQIDLTRDTPAASFEQFWKLHDEEAASAEVRNFSEDLVKGTFEHVAAIDDKISQYATNWKLQRMAVVDRNILRLGCFELMFRDDIPPKVSINEAVELAKKYSGLEASKFVNGILDKIKLEQQR